MGSHPRSAAAWIDTLAALVAAASADPEVVAVEEGQHTGFKIRDKTFVWFLHDHHGDGRFTLDIKAAFGVPQDLVGTDPERYHVPTFLGPHGWVGWPRP